MSGELEVRELRYGDLEALLQLYRDLHPEDEPIWEERSRALWGEILADAKQIYLGGFAGDELVAACNAAIVLNLTRGCRPFAVIENVVVSAQRRRRGFGATVLGELIERCWVRGCYKVMLMSASGRAGAHELYEALGFDKHSKQAFVMKR
jgi:GNAT superfamily N-acetyltransferase